jgi:hypothetical protein
MAPPGRPRGRDPPHHRLGAGQPVVPQRTRREPAVRQPMSLGPGCATTQPRTATAMDEQIRGPAACAVLADHLSDLVELHSSVVLPAELRGSLEIEKSRGLGEIRAAWAAIGSQVRPGVAVSAAGSRRG